MSKLSLMEQVLEKMKAQESIYVAYMVDKQKVTVVSYADFAKWEFIPPATFFIKDAMGDYIFVHTAKRAVAQEWIDKEYGKGRYSVNTSRLQKGKPLGEDSKPAFGTATRRGQKR
ncbi:hypothetical protein PJKIFABJ_00049 [Pseudomonas phage PE09]|jgi:hypothetical protein|uniref:Uncharacterized protein n=2 Tax=Otagovirus TaxID=2560197 RepID=A0A7S8BC30_9CAUD|nr:hypothetical protein QGX22_gp049 [Pseudomonas phage PE09]YP_010768355.1 hypothetical protein QGX23_gp047 [Pseudomonas phage PN09]QHZ60004.1 hypothetical protein PJKIFABJ_00049 [Pseudomonas phage PE09]QPB10468.1 hypothetical protein PN09_047 [Pseudomonas phage PN09]